jgi:hypothetical protein
MTTPSTLTLIIVGLAGLLIGLLVSGLLANRDAKSKKSTRLTKEMEKEGFLEVARLWYSPTSKSIMPELDGEFIADNASLSPDQQKKIFRISDLLGEWVRKAPVVAVPPEIKQEEAIANSIEMPVAPVISEFQSSPFIESPQVEQLTPPPAAFTSQAFNTSEGDAPESVDADEEEENLIIKPRTIAGQISLILEDMIKNTSLREKGIKLIEREDHGVDVWIGMEKFDGVESIPYPEAKQLIKAAAARWEKEASLRGKLGAD